MGKGASTFRQPFRHDPTPIGERLELVELTWFMSKRCANAG